MKNILLLLILLSLTTLDSCIEEELEARESINGLWRVTTIESYYGEFTTHGHNGLDIVTNEGSLGSFEFEEDRQVKYKFLRNDTTYQDTASWVFTSTSERQVGFEVTKYGLDISSDYSFGVTFGDNTRNSAKDARQMTLIQWPEHAGYGVGIVILLSKQ